MFPIGMRVPIGTVGQVRASHLEARPVVLRRAVDVSVHAWSGLMGSLELC